MTLIGRVRYAPPSLEDHGLITKSGQVFSVAVTEREYTVGEARTDVIGFYDGTWTAASGLSNREPASKDFTLWLEPRPQRNLKWELEQLCAALKDAVGFVRPDGLYLPLARADYTALGESSVDAVLLPRGEVWRHPLLDFTDSYTLLRESTAAMPLVLLSSTGKALSTLPISMMPRGSMFVGAYLKEPDLMSYMALGETVNAEGFAGINGIGIFRVYDILHGYVGSTEVTYRDPSRDGLKLLAMTWEVGKRLDLYMHSYEGFVHLGSAPLNVAPQLAYGRLSLGNIEGVASAAGTYFPGARDIEQGLPFIAPRVLTYPEVKDGLEAWWAELSTIQTFTNPLDLPSFDLRSTAGVDAVIDIPAAVTVTVDRINNYDQPIALSATSDHVGLRVTSVDPIPDHNALVDAWSVGIKAEAGVPYGLHTIKVTATGLDGLKKEQTFTVRVFEFAPVLPVNTTHFWKLYSSAENIADMPINTGSAGSAGDLVLEGLCMYTKDFDGVIGDGSQIPQYGASVATCNAAVADFSGKYTVSWAFWNPSGIEPNSVLFSMASQTAQNEFWQVFKDGGLLKLRTSAGTQQSLQVSSGGITAQGNVMHMSVRVRESSITLINPQTDEQVSLSKPAWAANAGRLTLFGTKLANNTVQGLSRGIALVGAIQNREVF